MYSACNQIGVQVGNGLVDIKQYALKVVIKNIQNVIMNKEVLLYLQNM